MGRLLLGELLH
uniref:Uncharacterized protein n=1 Tax=Medicago truncatula TaxID=3880 RepID=I3SFP0_MEDTR|nr:unknown [Medicago truncatula]